MRIIDAAGCVAAFCGRPELSDEELDFLLWERTPFPVSGWQLTVDHLVEELGVPPVPYGAALLEALS